MLVVLRIKRGDDQSDARQRGRNSALDSRGNFDSRIGVAPTQVGVFRVSSMVSGPINVRWSGTIGNDRGGTGPPFELPRCYLFDVKNPYESPRISLFICLSRTLSSSYAELELADRESCVFR